MLALPSGIGVQGTPSKSRPDDEARFEAPIYEITPDKITALPQATFAEAGLFELRDLQRLLREQIEVVAPDTLVIAEEFGDWQDSRRRIDLLAVVVNEALRGS